ncbi:Fc receptor-like protein 5 [Alosa pseudoharengus]|uniref:Fc receptor-like protein 5 n=1 Tax=Alosa pseudoharengus TaxID=34774 RepID=UPI003F8B6107
MTLHCISWNSSANSTADFYKDNSLLQSQTTGEMTITAVSKAHTGSYRCKHSVLGQSPGSWKTVIIRNGPSSILSIKPQLMIFPHSWVTEGDSVTLACVIGNTSLNWTFLWYRVVPFSKDLPYVGLRQKHYSAKLLPDSSKGAGRSYTLSPAALQHTGFYVCRAEGGDPTYQTGFSNVHPLSISGLSSPASLVIRPNRSQHFANGTISVSCELQNNSTRWKLRWQTGQYEITECPSGWTSEEEFTCSTRHLSPHDTGLYWCESESGQYSNLVHITVTKYNTVILESPAHPVTEGDSLTLRCLSRNGTSVNGAEFYKENSLIQTTTTGEMSIPSISKAHEGHYKCKHPELGRTPHSWVIVIRSPISVFRLVSSLVVVSPYLLVTVMLVVHCLKSKSRSKVDEDKGKHEVSEAETCI